MLYARFRKYVSRTGMLQRGDRVLAAVSGGSDSTAMLHLMVRLSKELPLEVRAGCIHHGLRKEADEEVEFVERLTREWEVPFHGARGDAAGRAERERKSIQHAAREMRYELLEDIARSAGATKIATGHTLDDQAETVFMNILRGCGIDGLSGIDPARESRYIRPVMIFRREELQDYLRVHGVEYVSDRSNLDVRYQRPRIRREIIPLMEKENPRLVRLMSGLADEARETSRFVDEEASRFIGESVSDRGDAWVIDRKVFADLPRAVQARVVRRMFLKLSSSLMGYTRPHVEDVIRMAREGSGSKMVRTRGGCAVRREYDRLVFEKGEEKADPHALDEEVAVPGPGAYVHEALGVEVEVRARPGAPGAFPSLVLRKRRRGDRLFGRKKTLKKLFIDAKVPRFARDWVPLLAVGKEVLWAGGVYAARTAPVEAELEAVGEPTPFLRWLNANRPGS